MKKLINHKLSGYTLLELIIVMVLSTIILALISMALFLVQKQIQHNKESFIYDQSLFMKVLDHHLFECHSIEIDKQTIRFNYPQKKFQIDFTEQGTILNTTDTLQIEARIIDFKVDERSNIVEHFNMEMHIRNQALTLLKKPAYSNAKKINSQFIDFSF